MAASRAALVDELRERVAPTVLAAERTLPMPEALATLFPEGGIVRGRSIVCAGPLSTTLAMSLVAPAVSAGSWVCLLDLPAIGVDALSEQGVPLERVVAVDDRSGRWADVASAVADGFDLLLTQIPDDVPPSALRRLAERLRRRGAVLIALDAPFARRATSSPKHLADTVLTTSTPRWGGLDDGAGHLRSCEVEIEASGRRLPGVRRCQLTLIRDDTAP